MKKRRLFRNIGLVALSALMVGSAAVSFTACGGGGGNTLDVYIFCNDADAATNNKICQDWAARYSQETGQEVKVTFRNHTSQQDYYSLIQSELTGGGGPDVMYLAPADVRRYAQTGTVLDLSEYLLSEEAVAGVSSIWQESVTFYAAYRPSSGGSLVNATGTIEYNANGAAGAGYYDSVSGEKVGIYGLPKDYSNFSMGYNKNFFTDEMKEAYTQSKASDVRGGSTGVSTQYYVSNTSHRDEAFHKGGTTVSDSPFITYAADMTIVDPITGQETQVHRGDEAYIINIGVPVNYKPFNFYRYATFDDALAAGDPMALATYAYSPSGRGYTVTIPGFPDETFEITNTDYIDENASYDASIGHIVYTYAEYGALCWAMTYYLNTFAWYNSESNSTHGGVLIGSKWQNVYGAEQYENALGPQLYVHPWLYANDASYITQDSKTVQNTADESKNYSEMTGALSSYIGTNTEDVVKKTLDGGTRTAKVQYGMDSERFIETYSAFHEFGATWNGNAGNAGDATDATAKGDQSGWDFFRTGAAIFYGAGSWDAATRNESDIDSFDFGQMAMPVAESYALYSNVRTTNYETKVYSNAETAKGIGEEANNDTAQRTTLSDGLKYYDDEAIAANQLKRQDKWGARMDSVGYAAHGRLRGTWKAAAAASLIMELTINAEAQKTLTYGGAQLPNIAQQCEDFLNYQEAGYENGAFSDMITPDGDAAGNDVWMQYYELAREMASAARSGVGTKVRDFMADKKITLDDGTQVSASYDEQYADVTLNASGFAGDNTSFRAYAMRVLRMVNLAKGDRDINLRMQSGLNSARDPLMYTTDKTWVTVLDQSTTGDLLAYINQIALVDGSGNVIDLASNVITAPGETLGNKYMTPAVLCIRVVAEAQSRLSSG